MDRRTTIKWVLAAGAAWPLARAGGARAGVPSAAPAEAHGYGTDPDLQRIHRPGDIWPLTLTATQRQLAGVLADIIIPADEHSPGASAVGVVDFIDEWVSAPYPEHRGDRTTIVDGFAWLDAEGARRSGKSFVALGAAEQHGICADICNPSRAAPDRQDAARFFSRFRDLTAGAFYSTPVGRKDLGFIGNVALTKFDGPPPELLKNLGLL
ncbi:MAG TPA: gluconate 2-dehydrogenase subunit 3 family protein [Steroidobacteraceae bacterium]|nr:gluconate 2-dehydrogenase subunit 3 family protein [Steroidobacteraceae bacterium]